ncbi:hypothetical protein R6Q59_003787 [Mikania micrantha]
MHRSSSSSRVSGDLSDHPSLQNYRTSSDATSEVLPTYNPHSYIATKEQNQIRSAEAAIHLIPLLLVICAIILWFFSDTDSCADNQSTSDEPNLTAKATPPTSHLRRPPPPPPPPSHLPPPPPPHLPPHLLLHFFPTHDPRCKPLSFVLQNPRIATYRSRPCRSTKTLRPPKPTARGHRRFTKTLCGSTMMVTAVVVARDGDSDCG